MANVDALDVVGYGALAWIVASAAWNALLRFDTPEGWVAWADAHPTLAQVTKIVRAFGVDPVKGLHRIGELLDMKAKKK